MRSALRFVVSLVILGGFLLVGSSSHAVVLNDSDDTVAAAHENSGRAARQRERAARADLPVETVATDAVDESLDGGAATARSGRSGRDRRRSCNQRLRQIIRQDDMVSLAKVRGDMNFKLATLNHLGRLELALKKQCPDVYAERIKARRMVQMARDMKTLMKLAAKYAVKYFTGGMSGLF